MVSLGSAAVSEEAGVLEGGAKIPHMSTVCLVLAFYRSQLQYTNITPSWRECGPCFLREDGNTRKVWLCEAIVWFNSQLDLSNWSIWWGTSKKSHSIQRYRLPMVNSLGLSIWYIRWRRWRASFPVADTPPQIWPSCMAGWCGWEVVYGTSGVAQCLEEECSQGSSYHSWSVADLQLLGMMYTKTRNLRVVRGDSKMVMLQKFQIFTILCQGKANRPYRTYKNL